MFQHIKTAVRPLEIRQRLYFGLLFLLSAFVVALSILKFKLLGIAVEELKSGRDPKEAILLFAAILLGNAIIVFCQSSLKNRYRSNTEYAYKCYTEEKMLLSSMKYIRGEEEGNLLTRMSSDLKLASSYLADGFLPLLQNVLTILSSIAVISLIHYKIMLYLIPIMMVCFVLQIIISRPLHPKRKILRDKMGASYAIVSDTIVNYNQIKTNRLEQWLLDRFDSSLNDIKKSYLKIFSFMGIFMGVGFIFSILPLIFLMFFASYLAASNVIGIQDFIVIIGIGVNVTAIVTSLSQNTATLQSISASLSRVSAIWDSPSEEAAFEASKAYEFGSDNGCAVSFSDVDFSYNDQKQIFEKFSYSFTKNKTYFIVGKNGSGKSTLSNLLSGLYVPDSGKISYRFSLQNEKLSELRDKISVVEQNTYLLDDTVENNIFPDPSKADSKVKNQWFSESHFSSIIEKLPNGKDTVLTGGGENLSGGQKRIISIARALVRDNELLIMDEPTANVDPVTAELISREIARVCENSNKTVLIITHDEQLFNIWESAEVLNFDELSPGFDEEKGECHE